MPTKIFPNSAADNVYTGLNDFSDGGLVTPIGTPVNATTGGAVLTVVDTPDAYVKNINSNITIEVIGQPLTVVDNVQASGTIEVSAILTAAQEFVVGAVTFVAVASLTDPAVAGEVLIGTDAADQAAKIVDAITRDTVAALCTASAVSTTVTVTAIAAGTGGNVILFSESIAPIVMTPAEGLLSGGVDAVVADTITIDSVVNTFVAGTPGVDEIQVGADVTETALNIAAAMPVTLTAVPTAGVIVVTAVADGVAGDGIVVNSTSAAIIGSGVTSGGVDEVLSYLTIGGIDYIFFDGAGDDPELDYDCVGVNIAAVAVNLAAALELDTVNFSAASVTVLGQAVTANHKTKGVIGNLAYVNNLITAGDITDNTVGGFFVGGVDGTPGLKGQIFYDGTDKYICTSDNYSTSQDSWVVGQADKLALKQNNYSMHGTLAPDSNLALSYFGTGRAVTRESDADTVLTFNDDMKTGDTFLFTRKNTHATLTRNTTIPVPRGGSSVYSTVAGEYNDIFIRWDSKNSMWVTRSSGSYAKVTS